MRPAAAALLILSLFMLCGALGLRTVQECEADSSLTRSTEKMNCYYQAAITAAYLCAPGQMCSGATAICSDIWVRFGAPQDPDTGSDIRQKAELTSNQCYFEVAKISRNPDTCGFITARDDWNTNLWGDAVTRDTCYDEAERLSRLAPENYYNSNPNNICAIVFILPLFVLGVGAMSSASAASTR